MADYDSTAMRWADVVTGKTDKSYLSNQRMPIYGDRIHSYGSHFEMARPLRDKKGVTVGFLINGNTYSNTTSKHQGIVRNTIARTGLPSVIIPHDALQAASILLDTVVPVDVQADWFSTREEVRFEMPGRWDYDTVIEDRGGWMNSKTNEFIARDKETWYQEKPKQITCELCETKPKWDHAAANGYEIYSEALQAQADHQRARHGEWEEVPMHKRNTGRKKVVSHSYVVWEIVDIGGRVAYTRQVQSHHLGGSLIRAQVRYFGKMRCTGTCGHTGQVEPWLDRVSENAYGPLTQRQDLHSYSPEYEEPDWLERGHRIRPRTVTEWAATTQCPTCRGTGWEGTWRQRWAYFLSGFDENETRPSYFFCELPPGATPTTYAEALDALKPGAVKVAEDMGREVKRQGDIFAIPMPGLTLKELKQRGGEHVKKPHLVIADTGVKYATHLTDDIRRAARDGDVNLRWSGPRPRLLNTNHEATEIVRVGRELYGRGTLRHVPDRRRPDHKMLPLGKDWHLILKNTVPLGA